MNCLECNGTGEVKPVSYRDNDPPKNVEPEIVEPKVPGILVRFLTWFTNSGGLTVLIITAIAGGLAWLMISTAKHEHEIAEENQKTETIRQDMLNKQGYVIAQYNVDGSVKMCWIGHDNETIKLAGNGAVVAIPDMLHPNDSNKPISIGIPDVNKCLRY